MPDGTPGRPGAAFAADGYSRSASARSRPALAAFLLARLPAWPPNEDETLVFFVAQQPLGDCFDTVVGERGGAPLHYLLAHLAGLLDPARGLRLLSSRSPWRSLPVVAALVARLADRRTALVAALLVAASWTTHLHGDLRADVRPLPPHDRALVPPPPARARAATARPLAPGRRRPSRRSRRSPTARSSSRRRSSTSPGSAAGRLAARRPPSRSRPSLVLAGAALDRLLASRGSLRGGGSAVRARPSARPATSSSTSGTPSATSRPAGSPRPFPIALAALARPRRSSPAAAGDGAVLAGARRRRPRRCAPLDQLRRRLLLEPRHLIFAPPLRDDGARGRRPRAGPARPGRPGRALGALARRSSSPSRCSGARPHAVALHRRAAARAEARGRRRRLAGGARAAPTTSSSATSRPTSTPGSRARRTASSSSRGPTPSSRSRRSRTRTSRSATESGCSTPATTSTRAGASSRSRTPRPAPPSRPRRSARSSSSGPASRPRRREAFLEATLEVQGLSEALGIGDAGRTDDGRGGARRPRGALAAALAARLALDELLVAGRLLEGRQPGGSLAASAAARGPSCALPRPGRRRCRRARRAGKTEAACAARRPRRRL